MNAVIIGNIQVGVDGQIGQVDVFTMRAGDSPAGGVQDCHALDPHVFAVMKENALAWALRGDIIGAFRFLFRGKRLSDIFRIHFRGVKEGKTVQVDGALARDGHMIVMEIDDQCPQTAQLVVYIILARIVLHVRRALDDGSCLQMQ